MRNNWLKGMAALAVCAAMAPGTARAGKLTEDLDFELTLDVVGKYVWRGQLVVDETSWQPGLSVTSGNLSVGVWGSADDTDINGSGESELQMHEVDLTISYGRDFNEMFAWEIGVINYEFPSTGWGDTWEVYGSVSASCLLEPTLTVYYDFDAVEGFYASFGVGHSFELIADRLGLSLGASIGFADSEYNEGYFGVDDSAFNDLTLGASLDVTITEYCSAYIGYNWSDILDDDLADDADESWVSGGIAFTF